MAILGRTNALAIIREAGPGMFLDGGEDGEILLPRRYIPVGAKPGDLLDVFVYRDSEDRLVATTEVPVAMVDEFAVLRVVGVKPSIGAFLDWGLAKDLLLPRREQTGPIREGDLIPVRIQVDPKSHRIAASARIHRWLDLVPPPYQPEQPVSLLITSETPLGYNAIVETAHTGLLYHSELAGPLHPGDRRQGFVRSVRPDGKINLALDPAGYVRVKPLSEKILEALTAAGGTLPFHDRSTPEEIRDAFGASKKAFKQALGALYRQRKILIGESDFRLAPVSAPKTAGTPTRPAGRARPSRAGAETDRSRRGPHGPRPR